ncbi:MAG TPA: endopeptidase La [Candidatus Acidoferrales bacterium]|nr:endopeptidase La [Candidatus Acidoferrales bacterium]
MNPPESKSLIAEGPQFTAPLLPLRDVVVYPHMVIPLFVGREKSIHALESSMEGDRKVLLVAQISAEKDDPTQDDLYVLGTEATILQLLKLPDGTVKVLVEGLRRAKLEHVEENMGGYLVARYRAVANVGYEKNRELEVLVRSVLNLCDQFVKLNKKIPPEVLTTLAAIEDAGRLADTIVAHMSLKVEQKQEVLELQDVTQRLERVMALIETEIDLLQIEKRIRGRVKAQMEKSQREYYLNEQMKAIQREIGELEDAPSNEMDELARRIEQAGMPAEARQKAEAELGKLKMMSPMSAEAGVVRNYLDALISAPWNKKTRVRTDLGRAQQVLDEDHYGLEKVKERILEYLAVQKRVRKLKGPILCLVGPPGVGKTSLGKSIARATNRKFTRMALGGVRDEAEIRGHRRTYIGSMPGKIIQNLSKIGSRNPLFLLDEVDKMAMDFRGDPASALLEVLDPEQNHTFNDHYLEVDFDLSDVMFVATANTLNIPPALLDRMEVIRLAGYIEDEKLHIAQQHILPRQMEKHGLSASELILGTDALRLVIQNYTREAGVRGLEREIAKICRKVVKRLALDADLKIVEVTPGNLTDFLGVPRYRHDLADQNDSVGRVTGLAWTEVGGELLTIETAVVPGKGKLIHTGSLGEVMQESIQAALTVVRSRSVSLGIDAEFHQKKDLHLHMPEGAIPKDGPSAGVGMVTALVSALTEIPVRSSVAMTGEITLRGQVLAIGGLKEKLIAAHRGGIKTVLIPEENAKDLVEIPANVKADLEIVPVKWIDEVLERALVRMPVPLPSSEQAGEMVAMKEAVVTETAVRSH